MANAMGDIVIDVSEVMAAADLARGMLSEKNMQRVLHDTNIDAARKTKTIAKKAVAQTYAVTQKWAAKHIKPYRPSGSVGAIIPMSGHRGSIGGTFKMKTGLRNRVVSAKILKNGSSPLPPVQKRQGGNPIFAARGVAFTRKTSDPLPIVRVVGRSLPQMVADNNVARPIIESGIDKYMEQRLMHHLNRAMNGWK